MSDKNGGAAFPSSGYQEWQPQGGMTLRDYFAAKSIQGMLSALDAYGLNYSNSAMMAEHAYAFADAMILERAK